MKTKEHKIIQSPWRLAIFFMLIIYGTIFLLFFAISLNQVQIKQKDKNTTTIRKESGALIPKPKPVFRIGETVKIISGREKGSIGTIHTHQLYLMDSSFYLYSYCVINKEEVFPYMIGCFREEELESMISRYIAGYITRSRENR